MGDYANMAVDDALNVGHNWNEYNDEDYENDSPWIGRKRKDRHRNGSGLFKKCQFCDKYPLFYHEEYPNKWILAEWNDQHKPIQHTCKMKGKLNRVRFSNVSR